MNKIALESIRKIQEAARKKVSQRLSYLPKEINNEEVIGKVRLESIKFIRKLQAEIFSTSTEFFQKLNTDLSKLNNSPVYKEILPPNCKYHSSFDGGGLIILEFLPQYRTVFTNNGVDHHNSSFTRKLAFPFLYFIISYSKIKEDHYEVIFRGIGCRNAPLKTMEDQIFHVPIPHTGNPTHLCQPSKKYRFNNLSDMLEDTVINFWGSKFIYQFYNFKIKNKTIKSYEEWETLSPIDMLNMTYTGGMTTKQLTNKAIDSNYNRDNCIRDAVYKFNTDFQIKMSKSLNLLKIESVFEDIIQSALQQK